MSKHKYTPPKVAAAPTEQTPEETKPPVVETPSEATEQPAEPNAQPEVKEDKPAAVLESTAPATTAEVRVTEHTPDTTNLTVEPLVNTTADAATVAFDQYAGLSVVSKTLLDIVDKHIAVLDPTVPVNNERGISSQRSFAAALVNIFKLKDAKDFISVMDNLIRKIVECADTAFSEKHAFRHWDSIPLAKERLKEYEYNLSALLTIAKSKDRKGAVRAVNFNMAFSNLTDTERSRLSAYFKRLAGL